MKTARRLCIAAGVVPAAWLLWLALHGQLGAAPLDRLTRFTGHWALVFLLACLAVTPLRRAALWLARRSTLGWGRRMSDWNGLVTLRRPLGLFAFAYAAAHLAIFFVLDVGADAALLLQELAEKRHLLLGLTAWLLLLPLALTSHRSALRRLKKNWKRLHWLVYPAACVALWHDWSQLKHGAPGPWLSTWLLAALLGARVWPWRAGERGCGDPVQPVPRTPPASQDHGAGDLQALRHAGD